MTVNHGGVATKQGADKKGTSSFVPLQLQNTNFIPFYAYSQGNALSHIIKSTASLLHKVNVF